MSEKWDRVRFDQETKDRDRELALHEREVALADEANRKDHVRLNFGFNLDADKLYQLLQFAK
jgi:hypothetical protein